MVDMTSLFIVFRPKQEACPNLTCIPTLFRIVGENGLLFYTFKYSHQSITNMETGFLSRVNSLTG